MTVIPAAPDLVGLRALVRESRYAVGLVALGDRTFVELSPAAIALTGVRPTDVPAVDLAAMTVDPSSVRHTMSLIAGGVLDACRIWTTVSIPGKSDSVLVSLRAVARDADQAYAIALFTALDTDPATLAEQPTRGSDSTADLPRVDELFNPLLGLADRDLGAFPGLEDLTSRQREILARLLRGDRVSTISRGMHLATSTVRNHLSTLYRKAGVHSQVELIERLHATTESRADG